jgi:hypothetical protein
MWHIVYIIAFTGLAVLAISNLVRNLMILGNNARNPRAKTYGASSGDTKRPVPHPELLDQDGQVIREPLLVMRSISMQDAREQLDSLYDGNSSNSDETEDANHDRED